MLTLIISQPRSCFINQKLLKPHPWKVLHTMTEERLAIKGKWIKITIVLFFADVQFWVFATFWFSLWRGGWIEGCWCLHGSPNALQAILFGNVNRNISYNKYAATLSLQHVTSLTHIKASWTNLASRANRFLLAPRRMWGFVSAMWKSLPSVSEKILQDPRLQAGRQLKWCLNEIMGQAS